MNLLVCCLAWMAFQQPDSPIAVDAPKDSPKAEAPDGELARTKEALAKYDGLNAKVAETADAHWKMSLWCEKNGLTSEAAKHLGHVIRLDPSREAAWKKLGFKKQDGRWMTEEQIAEDLEQKKADKSWGPLLKKIHKEIHRGKHRDEAQAELDKITDPMAVPSLYREFGAGGQVDQEIAVRVLGQVDSPRAAKVLAVIAVYGKTPEVRRSATETLRQRDAEDFLDILVGLMKDLLRYEVRPVGGPGSPGVLFVEGERFNVRRFYAPPPPPNLAIRPGDTVSFDNLGMPVLNRPTGFSSKQGVPGSKTDVYDREQVVQYSAASILAETQRETMVAQSQLQGDVQRIESINEVRKDFNDTLMGIAKDATGKILGKTPKEWREALAQRSRYAQVPAKTPRKPTISEMVPLAYLPTFGQIGFVTTIIKDS